MRGSLTFGTVATELIFFGFWRLALVITIGIPFVSSRADQLRGGARTSRQAVLVQSRGPRANREALGPNREVLGIRRVLETHRRPHRLPEGCQNHLKPMILDVKLLIYCLARGACPS